MPNWCFNRLLVAGNKHELRRFLKDITNTPNIKADPASALDDKYSLNKLVPLDPRGSIEKTYTQTTDDGTVVEAKMSVFSSATDGFDGYADAIDKWGSKWGACSVEIDDEDSYPLCIRYESAWSPADKLIKSISEQYPKLAFAVYFDEEANFFCGWQLFAEGKLIEQGYVNTDQPEELEKLAEKAADDESLLDEYWDAETEWRNGLLDRVSEDAETCLNEYLVWKRKADRQRKAGRYVDSFCPSV